MHRAASKQPRRAAAAVNTIEIVQDTEERDWAQLLPDLVRKVADDLLSADVTEYIRLRAVCKPWRNSTANPSLLHPRFFPRKWLLVAGEELRHDGEPERLVNVRTGARLRIRFPTPKEYTHHGNAEGLLVLHHSLTDTVCLLNPLTMAFTDLPSMSAVYDVALPPPGAADDDAWTITAAGVVVVDPPIPTVVLSLTLGTHTAIVCAEPGDNFWRAVDVSAADDIECELPVIHGGLSVQGRFFVPTRAGDVLGVELGPQPRLTYVAKQAGEDAPMNGLNERCYLVPSGKDDGMLLMRTWGPGNIYYNVYTVDLGNSSLTPHAMGGTDTTVFLPSVTVRSSGFPNVLPNQAYAEENMELLLHGDFNVLV
ncbi:unnamed protein product [Urochloa decumbens]|uniref:KIB1-4 beta-propeller domain-containing protein n=1 Tax=Urochloa decumbens TaxID=240449 RepID=A0ABC8VJN5_9POAL